MRLPDTRLTAFFVSHRSSEQWTNLPGDIYLGINELGDTLKWLLNKAQ